MEQVIRDFFEINHLVYDVRIFGFNWKNNTNVHNKWFVFDGAGCECWIVGDYIDNDFVLARPATKKDWVHIGGWNSKGFKNQDFRDCELSGYDFTGTSFTKCKFVAGHSCFSPNLPCTTFINCSWYMDKEM